jgi:Tol biopolymer transport system component
VYSPNRDRIAFTSNRDGLLIFDIYVMNRDGSGQTRLTTDPAAHTSPDV